MKRIISRFIIAKYVRNFPSVGGGGQSNPAHSTRSLAAQEMLAAQVILVPGIM
jgi:hypothetical protein